MSHTINVPGSKISPFSVDDVTDATSATTGSIQTDGGLGVAKDLWVGNDINADGNVIRINEANNGVANTLVNDLRTYDSAGNSSDIISLNNSTNKIIIGEFNASSAQDGVVINDGSGSQNTVFQADYNEFNSANIDRDFRIEKNISGRAFEYDAGLDEFNIDSQFNVTEGVGISIGDTAPTNAIDIAGTSAPESRIRISRSNSGSGMPSINLRKSRGTIGTPTAILSNDVLSRIDSYGHNGTDYIVAGRMQFTATENFSGTNEGVEFKLHLNEKGTTAIRAPLTISNETINSVASRTRFNISNLPTSATGLNTGDLWNNSGVVNVA